MNGPLIETERLILRPHIEADFEPMHAIWIDPEGLRFIAAAASTRQQSWFRLLRTIGMWSVKGFGPFALIDKQTGRYIGEAGHADFRRGLGEAFDPYPEAGWLLARELQGRGYATEALLAALEWFDANRPEPRTVCIIDPENAPSLRLAETAGYRPFGETKIGERDQILFERFRPADTPKQKRPLSPGAVPVF